MPPQQANLSPAAGRLRASPGRASRAAARWVRCRQRESTSEVQEQTLKTGAFYPDRGVEQIQAFFHDVHDISDFYYKLYLLNALRHSCDGRGYLRTPDQPCLQCQASGSADVWRRVPSAPRQD